MLYSIIVGVLAGFLAGTVVKGRGFGCLVNLIVGAIGAVIGSWLFTMAELPIGSGFFATVFKSFVGAVILLAIVNLVNKDNK